MGSRSHPRRWSGFGVLALAAALGACSQAAAPVASAPEGNADRGRSMLQQYGCAYCHVIPGVATARGTFGPPLENVGKRVYLAGTLPNSRANMAAWIRAPQAIKPGTAMLDLHVTETDARDMVAYLYRLR
jgi:cytochrome c2